MLLEVTNVKLKYFKVTGVSHPFAMHRGTDEDQSIHKSRPAGPPSNVKFCLACMVLKQACSGAGPRDRLSPGVWRCGGLACCWCVWAALARVGRCGAVACCSCGWRRRLVLGLGWLAERTGGGWSSGGGGALLGWPAGGRRRRCAVFVAALGRVVPSASGGAGAGRAWLGPGGVVAWGSSLGRLRFLSPPGVFGWALLALGGASGRPAWHGCSNYPIQYNFSSP